jgi:hypothetical protein
MSDHVQTAVVPCPMCFGIHKQFCDTCTGTGVMSIKLCERAFVRCALILLAREQDDMSNASQRCRAPILPSVPHRSLAARAAARR